MTGQGVLIGKDYIKFLIGFPRATFAIGRWMILGLTAEFPTIWEHVLHHLNGMGLAPLCLMGNKAARLLFMLLIFLITCLCSVYDKLLKFVVSYLMCM